MTEKTRASIHFVGAGPGAVDLITVRGAETLKKAQVVVYAGSLVNPALLEYCPDAKVYDSAKMTLDEVIDVMASAHNDGLELVRLHSGDPSVYGAIREQMDALDRLGIPYDSCPGVSACFGAAASLNLEYTVPGVAQSLIITRMAGKTATPPLEQIESFAAHRTSMAIYLSAGRLQELSERLIAGGYPPTTPTALVYKATWPDEKKFVCALSELAEVARANNITKTALILVGGAINPERYEKSRLYAPDFSTEFRKARSSNDS